MPDLTPIKGVIELRDNFTGRIGTAQNALSKFSKNNQESMKAIAGATGLVVAGITAINTATIALGLRGSEVQNIERGFKALSGESDALKDSLRAATEGLVSDFDLMAASNKALLLGLPATKEEMGILAESATALGRAMNLDTATALDNLIVALGRSSPLILDNLGLVVKTGEANQKYADQLGKTVSQLTDAEKKTAFYNGAMDAAKAKTAELGEFQLTFADRLKRAQVGLGNFTDGLAQAVAVSPVFAAGMDSITRAVSEAFGDDQQDAIEFVLNILEQTAIFTVDLGIAAIETARVMNVAWSLVKTTVLALETAIVGVMTGIVIAIDAVAQAGAALNIIPEGVAERIKDTRTTLEAMTVSLAKQTAEAARGVVGQSEFDRTLDKLGGTLFQVRDAMVLASEATDENNAAMEISTRNAQQLARVQKQITEAAIKRAEAEKELAEAEKERVKELGGVWQELFDIRNNQSLSSLDAQREAIDEWFRNEVAQLDESNENWQEHYDLIAELAGEKLAEVGVDWDHLKRVSIDSLQDQAEVARRTYDEMIRQSGRFTRQALQEQLQKVKETSQAARSMGRDFVTAHVAATAAADGQTKSLDEVRLAAEAAARAAGAISSSFQVTVANLSEQARSFGINPATALAWAKLGYSFEQILQLAKIGSPPPGTPQGPGPRIPGFQQGGTVMVGEGGPEIVRLPLGSQVFPTGTLPPGELPGNISLTFHVNGTANDVAQQIKRVIMRELKSIKQFGSA